MVYRAKARDGSAKAKTKISKSLDVRNNDQKKKKKKTKMPSIKNQMRSLQRLLNKPLPDAVKESQLQRLQDLKRQAELHRRAERERKLAVRYHKVKFFERRKIERRIAKLEKLQKAATENPSSEEAGKIAEIEQELASLKEELEYVRFFPKTEKYVSLFMGNDDEEIIAKRKKLREQIKANIAAAAASGVELEETVSDADNDDDEAAAVAMESIEDDFFLSGNTSDGAVDEAEEDGDWAITKFRPIGSKTGIQEKHSDSKWKNKLPGSKVKGNNIKHNHGMSNLASYGVGNKSKQNHVMPNLGSQKQRPLHGHSNDKFKNKKPANTSSARLFKNLKGGQLHGNQKGGQHLAKNMEGQNSNPSFTSQLSASKKTAVFSRSSSNTGKSKNQSTSSSRSDINKVIETPTVGSSNSEAQQKRKRKRRPKKKK